MDAVGQLRVFINGTENHGIEHIEYSRSYSAPEYVIGGRGHRRLFIESRAAEVRLTFKAPTGANIPDEIDVLEVVSKGIGVTFCQLTLLERWPTLRDKEAYTFIGFQPNQNTFAPKNNAQALHKLNKGEF